MSQNTQRTLSLIKPDAVGKAQIGAIVARLEAAGLRVVAMQMLTLTPQQAGDFYAAHRERPFYGGLVEFMTSGPIVAQVLEGDNAVAKNRETMGATNPKDAAAGSIRADFAANVEQNAVHGSDSPQSAAAEIAFFFPELAPR
jgi:nucleoside-diphosphate kinase